MKRTLVLNEHPIEVDPSMGWLYVYRREFEHDILPDLLPLLESVIAGTSDVLVKMIENGKGDKSLSASQLMELMNSDSIIEAIITMAKMELITLLNILWAMRKNAVPETPDPEKFVNSFDRMPLFDELAPALFYMILDSSVSIKNSRSLLEKIETAMPSISTLLPSQQSTEG